MYLSSAAGYHYMVYSNISKDMKDMKMLVHTFNSFSNVCCKVAEVTRSKL